MQHPSLWWPNGYGEPALHALTVRFSSEGRVSSQQQIDFGMREVSYELSLMDATGHLRRVEVLPSRTHDEAAPLIDESNQGIWIAPKNVSPSAVLKTTPLARLTSLEGINSR